MLLPWPLSPPPMPFCSRNSILQTSLFPKAKHLCPVPSKMGFPLPQMPSGSSFLKESFTQVHLSGRAQISCICDHSLLCVWLCDPMDCSPPGSSVLGILQAAILEWVAMPSSRRSSRLRDRTCVSCTAGRYFTAEPPGTPQNPIPEF